MDRFAGRILDALRCAIDSRPLVRTLNDFAREVEFPVHLVGGFLRDAAVGRSAEGAGPDLDCAVPDAGAAARRFAERTGGRLVRLDPANWRVNPGERRPADASTGRIDFSDLRGKDIRADLRARDFALNALACRLPDPREIIDPENGLADLQARLIRAVHDRVLQDDPIRILRAYRLSAQLSFRIDPATVALIRRDAARLRGQPGERVRAELFGMLDGPRGGRMLSEMRGAGVLHVLFPECARMDGVEQGGVHHADVLTHSLETVEALEDILDDRGSGPLGRESRAYLSLPHRLPVLKLAALLHDAGKPDTKAGSGPSPAGGRSGEEERRTFHGHEKVGAEKALHVARELRLSRRERESLVRLVRLHMRPGWLYRDAGGDAKALSARALHRLARDAGDDMAGLALLALADAFSRRGPLGGPAGRARLLNFAHGVIAELRARILPVLEGPRLVRGTDLMRSLGIPEGPEVGGLLGAVEEAQAAGEVKTKEEALDLARRVREVRREKPVEPHEGPGRE